MMRRTTNCSPRGPAERNELCHDLKLEWAPRNMHIALPNKALQQMAQSVHYGRRISTGGWLVDDETDA